MSRSFKHRGFIQDQSSKSFGKRLANRRVRIYKDKLNNKEYRKVFDSWNIADYILQARGVLELIEHRPGRKFKKVRLGGDRNSWYGLMEEYKDRLWRDWSK